MATTTVSDAIVIPQDPGTGLSNTDDPISAALAALHSMNLQEEYVPTSYAGGLQFINHDGANDEVDIDNGLAFIKDTSGSTTGSRGSGGNPQAQSNDDGNAPPSYDTEIPDGHYYAVLLPTSTTISVGSSQSNEVYLNIADIGVNNDVTIIHDDGNGVSAPTDTYLKLGATNPDDASADTRANDDAALGTITAGDGLKSGGELKKDGSVSLDAEPADIAGLFLSDDGSDNLTVDLAGSGGLKDDGSGNITVEASDFAGAGVQDDGSDNIAISERIHYEPGHTEIPDGQSDQEYHRISPPAGESVTITSMQFQQQGGGSSTSVNVDVYDVGAGSVVNDVNLGSRDSTTASANSGNTVIVRITNASGGKVNAAPTIDGYIA